MATVVEHGFLVAYLCIFFEDMSTRSPDNSPLVYAEGRPGAAGNSSAGQGGSEARSSRLLTYLEGILMCVSDTS